MGAIIPTTEQQKVANLARIEGEINQTTPDADKAFNKVLSAMEALQFTVLYKYGIERMLQVLAITATKSGLDLIGANLGVTRKPAEAAVLEISLPGTDPTVIPATVDYIGDANGVRYFPDSSTITSGGFAVSDVTAGETGVVGNLQIGDTLQIGTQIAGAETIATVTDIVNIGAEEETDDAYRLRVLDKERAVSGGANGFDYRTWAEEVAGVARAYPYSGRPIDDPVESVPPDRTVYVEADTTIDPDGLAPQSLLDEVRDSITTDPVTGLARQPLGLTDETLFVVSITRTEFFVQINDLIAPADIEATVKSKISTALENYFTGIQPFVDSIDSVLDRNDLITDLTVSEVVQDVLSANGSSAGAVSFGITVGVFIPQYRLNPGELGKSGGVTYV